MDEVRALRAELKGRVTVVLRAGDPLAMASPVDLRLLSQETVMVTGDPYVGWADYRDRLGRIGADPAEIMVIAQATTILAMVAAGLGVAILGAFAAQVAVFGDDVVAPAAAGPLVAAGDPRLPEGGARVHQAGGRLPRPPPPGGPGPDGPHGHLVAVTRR
ncbi:LysR family transcriptional regulator substrate-binding protein [Nonomuraea jabiensis]|uniref:LysR family transcriptional regulator substrate-binding protein n=1 Tax=Nonomuraea jabiensis TaxID=882448 RepID=UPI003D7390FA